MFYALLAIVLLIGIGFALKPMRQRAAQTLQVTAAITALAQFQAPPIPAQTLVFSV